MANQDTDRRMSLKLRLAHKRFQKAVLQDSGISVASSDELVRHLEAVFERSTAERIQVTIGAKHRHSSWTD